MAAFCFYGTANLLLESPFLAHYFGTAGLGHRMGANGGPGTNTAKAFTWQLTQKQFVVTLLGRSRSAWACCFIQ